MRNYTIFALALAFAFAFFAFANAAPAPKAEESLPLVVRAAQSLQEVLEKVLVDAKAVGVKYAGKSGIKDIIGYSKEINKVITVDLAACVGNIGCTNPGDLSAIGKIIGDLLTEINTLLDSLIGANGLLSITGFIAKLFTQPLIQAVLTLLSTVTGLLGESGLGPTFDLKGLLGLIDLGNLTDLLKLLDLDSLLGGLLGPKPPGA